MKKKLLCLVVTILSILSSGAARASNWTQVGNAFGSRRQFSFGIDRQPIMGGCILDERMDAQFLGGPCIKPAAIRYDGKPTLGLGFGVLYNAEHGNASYNIYPGFTIGPVASIALNAAAERIPYLENLTNIEIPKFWTQIANATEIFGSIGWRPIHSPGVHSDMTAGFGFRIDGSDAVEKAASLIQKGLGYGPDGSITMQNSYLPPKLALIKSPLNLRG